MYQFDRKLTGNLLYKVTPLYYHLEMRQKRPANFRLTPEAIMLLAALAKRRGISRAAVLELLIRKEAKHVLTKEGAEKLTVSEGIEK